ncbi:hypothetical protein HPB50_019035 [Hyalomma asiaticum]|uniref:Uncharacterized protein n=1 Tax=Hyalomma asiaticum TaxID=266040 RepID=A0ACB7TJU5_HYAAI|nr:hypothetical protein HPB50_019035 [Hyalomma asiaticum]
MDEAGIAAPRVDVSDGVQLTRDEREDIQVDPLPRNIHPVHHAVRLEARARAILRTVGSDAKAALFVDAAEYSTRRAFGVSVVDGEGQLVARASVCTDQVTVAEEIAIALALQAAEAPRVDYSDSRSAVRAFFGGLISQQAARLLLSGRRQARWVGGHHISCFPAHVEGIDGVNPNASAHTLARECTNRAGDAAGDGRFVEKSSFQSCERLVLCLLRAPRKKLQARCTHSQSGLEEENANSATLEERKARRHPIVRSATTSTTWTLTSHTRGFVAYRLDRTFLFMHSLGLPFDLRISKVFLAAGDGRFVEKSSFQSCERLVLCLLRAPRKKLQARCTHSQSGLEEENANSATLEERKARRHPIVRSATTSTTWTLTSHTRGFVAYRLDRTFLFMHSLGLPFDLRISKVFLEADIRDSERHSGEVTDPIGCFESKGDEPPTEKGFGSFERIGEVDEEVTVPLDDHGGCRAVFESEVGTTECVSLAVDTCGAGMV